MSSRVAYLVQIFHGTGQGKMKYDPHGFGTAQQIDLPLGDLYSGLSVAVPMGRTRPSSPIAPLTASSAAESIAELIDVIGPVATRQLCEAFGGVCFERITEDFDAVIGSAKATRLREHWGRGRIAIPKRAEKPSVRRARVLELKGKGVTHRDIALATGYCERHVYFILAQHRDAA